MDNYIIDLNTGEWWIYKEGFDFKKQDDYQSFKNDYGFAKSGMKNGKIIYFFDIYARDNDIEKAKNDKLFLRKAKFKVLKNNKGIKNFDGTFINALRYIKKVYNAK